MRVSHSYHAFGVGVAKVGGMGWPVVDHGLVDGVGRLVGEYAGGQAGHHLGNHVSHAYPSARLQRSSW